MDPYAPDETAMGGGAEFVVPEEGGLGEYEAPLEQAVEMVPGQPHPANPMTGGNKMLVGLVGVAGLFAGWMISKGMSSRSGGRRRRERDEDYD